MLMGERGSQGGYISQMMEFLIYFRMSYVFLGKGLDIVWC